MQLGFLYELVQSKNHSNPDGKGMFVDVYLLQKAGVSIWEKGREGEGGTLVKIFG